MVFTFYNGLRIVASTLICNLIIMAQSSSGAVHSAVGSSTRAVHSAVGSSTRAVHSAVGSSTGAVYSAVGSESACMTLSAAIRVANQGCHVTVFTGLLTSSIFINQTQNMDVITIPKNMIIDKLSEERRLLGFRFAKIWTFINSPYDFTVFLDADTHVCQNIVPVMNIVDTLMGNKYIIAAHQVHEDYGEYNGFNTGVVFFRKIRETKQLFEKWMQAYKSAVNEVAESPCSVKLRAYDRCSSNESGTQIVQDQPSFYFALEKEKILPLPLEWRYNCKNALVLKYNRSKHPCCGEDFQQLLGSTCIIDHRCY